VENLALTPEQKYKELYQKFANVSGSKTLYHSQVVSSIKILCDEMLANEPPHSIVLIVPNDDDYSWTQYWDEVKSYC